MGGRADGQWDQTPDPLPVCPPVRQTRGPAAFTPSDVSPANLAKLSRNMPASFLAWAS